MASRSQDTGLATEDGQASMRAAATTNSGIETLRDGFGENFSPILSAIASDPVAMACCGVVLVLFLSLLIALFIKRVSSRSRSGVGEEVGGTELVAGKKGGIGLEIPRRCQYCTKPNQRKRNKKPLPKLAIYIPEVTEKVTFKLWEAPETVQTAPATSEDVL